MTSSGSVATAGAPNGAGGTVSGMGGAPVLAWPPAPGWWGRRWRERARDAGVGLRARRSRRYPAIVAQV
ncbi:hypothetical protein GCM10027047_35060 [Rhodococcus aerolatus]